MSFENWIIRKAASVVVGTVVTAVAGPWVGGAAAIATNQILKPDGASDSGDDATDNHGDSFDF